MDIDTIIVKVVRDEGRETTAIVKLKSHLFSLQTQQN